MVASESILFPVRQEEKWGFIDRFGNLKIPMQFARVNHFSDGVALVTIETETGDSTQGFIDATGGFVVEAGPPPNFAVPKYRERAWGYHDFNEGLAGFWVGDARGKGGYIDKSGQVVIPVQYQEISDFSEGLACVAMPRPDKSPFGSKLTGFIDRKGKFVIEPTQSFVARGFSGDMCRISVQDDDGNWTEGFIDRTGKIVVPTKYHKAAPYSDGLSCVRKRTDGKSKFGFIDTDGKVVVPLEFDYATSFSSGRAYAEKNGRAVIINLDGRIEKQLDFDAASAYVRDFSEGLADVMITTDGQSRSGFIDENGSVVIPIEFDHADPFQGRLARASKDGVTGYINREGEFVWSSPNWGPW